MKFETYAVWCIRIAQQYFSSTYSQSLLYQVYKYEMRIFFLKKHVKFGRLTKSGLFKVCSVACYTFSPIFRAICEYHVSKIFFFCCEPFIEPFFHIFVRIKALLSKVRNPLMQTSGNRKELSPVSKPHEVELPSWVFATYREPVLAYMMEHFHKEKWLCIVSFDILAPFQSRNGSNRSIVVGNV